MKKRILIVGDGAAVRSALETRSRVGDYLVESVATAEAALQAVHVFQADVILADLHVPGMGALDLMADLRRRGVSAPVIIVNGQESMRGAIEAVTHGAYDYMVRPLDAGQLERALARCFRDQSARGEPPLDPPAQDMDLLVGRTPTMIEIYKTIAMVAQTRAPVLIRGETGTGKELIARSIHNHSQRAHKAFVAVNCGAMPESLLESELFGHVKGSFTGAISDRKGRFESTGSGTLFLDEIGDTSPMFQVKLLRVLQDGEFFPVGGETPRKSEACVVAATHYDIEELVRTGAFRQDLYFRLRVVEIFVPPLRDRTEDVPRLARHFLAKAACRTGKSVRVIPSEVMRRLLEHDWPGNVRELENAIMRAAVLARGAVIHTQDLGLDPPPECMTGRAGGKLPLSVFSLDEAQREQVLRVLARTKGCKRQAARILKVGRGRLDRLIEKFGVDVGEFTH